jgi:hypothetical protein
MCTWTTNVKVELKVMVFVRLCPTHTKTSQRLQEHSGISNMASLSLNLPGIFTVQGGWAGSGEQYHRWRPLARGHLRLPHGCQVGAFFSLLSDAMSGQVVAYCTLCAAHALFPSEWTVAESFRGRRSRRSTLCADVVSKSTVSLVFECG